MTDPYPMPNFFSDLMSAWSKTLAFTSIRRELDKRVSRADNQANSVIYR